MRILPSSCRRASRWCRRLRSLVSRVGLGRDALQASGVGVGLGVLGDSDIRGWACGMCGSRVVRSLNGCVVDDSNYLMSAL